MGVVIVVSIDRSIMHRIKNRRDLVTYREDTGIDTGCYLVLVSLYSSVV